MKFCTTILCSLLSQVLTVSVAARPGWSGNCISDADANLVATSFGLTVSNYSLTLVDQLFAPNFTDQSDSVLQLINAASTTPIPLGSLAFASRAAFIAAQGSQPSVPFAVKNVWHTCDTVIVRWLSAQSPDQVQGISILTVELDQSGGGVGVGDKKYQIYHVFAEFNSGAWLVDLGSPNCANVTAS